MKCYSYKITRDYGFAPNPFFGYCTLATCKPKVRKVAKIGDWILGNGSVKLGNPKKIIFLMKIEGKLSFTNYFNDPRFSAKKPILNGSLVKIHGDNIYHKEDDQWSQLDSHHSLRDGQINEKNLNQDTASDAVLFSRQFYYFGKENISVPEEFEEIISDVRDYKKYDNIEKLNQFIKWVENNFEIGIHGDPINWHNYLQKKLF